MSYIKFEARHLNDDRWLHVSPSAFVVHTWALSYCNEQATDGLISAARAARLVCPVAPAKITAAWDELVLAGLWVATDDGYRCDTFAAHGIDAAEQSQTRTKWAEDKRRRRLHSNGNHSLCTARSCPVPRGQVEMSTGGQVDTSTEDKWTTRPDPTRSDSTRPDPTLRGGEEEGAANASTSARAPGDATPVVGKHHHAPDCCEFSGHPSNRRHWRPGECPGCADPRHAATPHGAVA